jgi:hypothetical protein
VALSGSEIDDRGRLARILGRLDPDDQAWLLTQFEPPWQRRARRLAARDAAIRELIPAYNHLPSGRAMAKVIAKALRDYSTGAFRFERGRAPPASARRALLWRVLSLNQGSPPSQTTIRYALAAAGQKSKRLLATPQCTAFCDAASEEERKSDGIPAFGGAQHRREER